MAKTEIERKFLVNGDAFMREAVESHRLVQGYICRESGRTVLIRGALPGEVVECTILGGARGVLKAAVVDVLEPSSMRRVPICPYYGRRMMPEWHDLPVLKT